MAETMSRISSDLYVATRQGIVAISSEGGEPEAFPFALYGIFTRCLLGDGKGVLLAAGTGDRGVRASKDAGRTWLEPEGMAEGDVRVLAGAGASIWAGSAPAALHHSSDGGGRFSEVPLAGPYTDRWASAPAEDGPRVTAVLASAERLLVGVNHGGVILSADQGKTFRDVSGDLPLSVLGVFPAGPGEARGVLAGTASGLYRCDDPATARWEAVWQVRERSAVTALSYHPRAPQVMVCGAASALSLAKPAVPQGADAWIYRSADGGATWSEVDGGLLPVMRGVVTSVVFAPADPARVFAGTSSGEIFESRDAGVSFRMTVSTLPGVLGMVPGGAIV